jgi:hypothetical protein
MVPSSALTLRRRDDSNKSGWLDPLQGDSVCRRDLSDGLRPPRAGFCRPAGRPTIRLLISAQHLEGPAVRGRQGLLLRQGGEMCAPIPPVGSRQTS